MLLKLFALYPPQPDVELRMEAYLEELSGVPWRWVSRACSRITAQKRVFCPSVSELKAALAEAILAARRKHEPELVASLAAGAMPDGQIGWLRCRVADSLQRGILPPGVQAADLIEEPLL